jgi:hypothetical protein
LSFIDVLGPGRLRLWLVACDECVPCSNFVWAKVSCQRSAPRWERRSVCIVTHVQCMDENTKEFLKPSPNVGQSGPGYCSNSTFDTASNHSPAGGSRHDSLESFQNNLVCGRSFAVPISACLSSSVPIVQQSIRNNLAGNYVVQGPLLSDF